MWVRVAKSNAVKIGNAASQLNADAARALRIRSDALNRKYHLGAYAPAATKAKRELPQPAAPGSGVPVQASTSDDYDNPQVLYDNSAPERDSVADSPSSHVADAHADRRLRRSQLSAAQAGASPKPFAGASDRPISRAPAPAADACPATVMCLEQMSPRPLDERLGGGPRGDQKARESPT